MLEIIFYLWVEEFRIWHLKKDLFKVFQFQMQCYLTDYVSSRLVFVKRISKRSCITDLNLYLYFSLAWRAQKEAVSLEHFQIWYITVFPISCVGSHVHTPAHAPLVWCVWTIAGTSSTYVTYCLGLIVFDRVLNMHL